MIKFGNSVSLIRLFLFRTVSLQFVIYAGHKFYHINYSGDANPRYAYAIEINDLLVNCAVVFCCLDFYRWMDFSQKLNLMIANERAGQEIKDSLFNRNLGYKKKVTFCIDGKMNVQKIQNSFLRAYNLACYLKILLLVILVITFQNFGKAQQVLFCVSQVLFTVYTAVYGLTAKTHCPAHKIDLIKNLIFEGCLMIFSIVGVCLAFIETRGFDGSASDQSSLATVFMTIGQIFLMFSFWLHENFILVWYNMKFMLQSICVFFRKHEKVGVVENSEKSTPEQHPQAIPSC
jgi:hypothetical protein